MDNKRLDKTEKEIKKIKELDDDIKYLKGLLENEQKRYDMIAYQCAPPPDNTKGYTSVRNPSDPTCKAVIELENEKHLDYVLHIKDGIEKKEAERREIVQRLDRLPLLGKVKQYALEKYIKGKPTKEAAGIVDISSACATRYRRDILTAYADMYNF